MDFIIRPYTKKEIALMYFPESEPRNASRRLMAWIKHCKPLYAELLQAGYRPMSKSFTPRQAEIIGHYLGCP